MIYSSEDKTMIFFTEVTCEPSNYCLLHVGKYNCARKLKKKEILVDPGVLELTKLPDYSKIKLLHELASGGLQKNEWISIDYPPYMDPSKANSFIKKSVENNFKYKDNDRYICCIQYFPRMIDQFTRRLGELLPILQNPKKMIGIGGIKDIEMPNMHTNLLFHTLMKEISPRRIHLYGPAETLIEKYVPLLERKGWIVSVDSTKWTRACTVKLKRQHGLYCHEKKNLYFEIYMKKLSKRLGVDVIY